MTISRFEVAVKFSIPNIIIEPTLDAIKTSLARIAEVVLNTSDKICWWAGEDIGEPFLTEVVQEPAIESTMRSLDGVVEGILICLRRFNNLFLRKMMTEGEGLERSLSEKKTVIVSWLSD